MKKLLFFLSATILFASCSNDSEEVPTTSKTYKVTFDVSNFSVNVKSLKADTFNNQLFYVIYDKESGKGVKGWTFEGMVGQVTEELPEGNYYIAFISHPRGGMSSPPTEGAIDVKDNNFYTDYFENSPTWIMGNMGNRYVYYQKVDFSVAANNSDVPIEVTLQPMWSEVTVEVTDANTCFLPEGTTTIGCVITPFYSGISIAEGIPTRGSDASWGWADLCNTNVDKFREHKIITDRHATAGKDVTVKLVFVKQIATGDTVLGEREIYKGDIEGGKRITFRGALGKAATSATFKVSLADLTDAGIIPFD